MLSVEPNERVAVKIMHEDEHLLVCEKPPGRVTNPGKGHESDTLLNGLFATHGARLQRIGREREFGLLHRLDRETSGMVMVALTRDAYDAMGEQFRSGGIGKFYFAITKRAPNRPSGVIRRPLAEQIATPNGVRGVRARDTVRLVRVAASGKPSLTAYRTLHEVPGAALLETRAVTGRLHQVRAHLQSIGCAILGDAFYGTVAVAGAAPRLALHAHRITLTHPATGEAMDLRSKLPRDLKHLCRKLGLDAARATPGLRIERAHEAGGDSVGEQEA